MGATIRLENLLSPSRGIVAVMGSGGKSTLLARGGAVMAAAGRTVALSTTTHMLPPARIALVCGLGELDAELARSGIAAIGELDEETGKLSEPACGIGALARHADLVLVEADGSKRLPLKAHGPWEPVVPTGASRTILIVGASGFWHPIAEAVHRPEVFSRLTGARGDDPADPELVARAIAAEGLVGEKDLVIVNQVDGGRGLGDARALARGLRAAMPIDVYAGSLEHDALLPL